MTCLIFKLDEKTSTLNAFFVYSTGVDCC